MELEDLSRTLAPVMNTPELKALSSLLASPARMVLLGRTSAGKTTYLNQITGSTLHTGLGGITREPVEVEHHGRVWVDTPGIDGRDKAIDTLGPLVDDADAVVWIVDGLQPATRTERDVLQALMPPGMPLYVVISRIDLVPEDSEAILARVEKLAGPFQPLAIWAADMRSTERGCPAPDTSPRRERAIDIAYSTLRTRFDALPQPLASARLAGILDARGQVKRVLSRLEGSRNIAHLLEEFASGMEGVRDGLVVSLAAERALSPHLASLPELPPIPTAGDTPMQALRQGVVGLSGIRRDFRAAAAGWAAEVGVLLSEWAEALPTDDLGAAAWSLADDALNRAETARRTARSS